MLLFGLLVIADALRKVLLQEVPAADWMAAVGALALLANGYCFALLYRHRADDLNMRSTWLCSRNDLLANSSVIVAAGLVALTGSLWPDILVGLAIAALFLHSARQVIREAREEWRTSAAQPQPVRSNCAGPSRDEPDACCAAKSTAGNGDEPLRDISEPSHSQTLATAERGCCGQEQPHSTLHDRVQAVAPPSK